MLLAAPFAALSNALALVMRNVPDAVVWLGVIGFTVTALGLAHTMGMRARERIDNGGRALGSASVWLLLGVWLTVGVTAFIIRLTAAPAATSAGTAIVLDGQPVSLPGTGAGLVSAAKRASTWAMSPTSSTSGTKYWSISAATLSITTICLSPLGFQYCGACSTRSYPIAMTRSASSKPAIS